MATKTGYRWHADLQGEDGNAFVVMGVARKIIRKTLGDEEASKYAERARSGDYANLLAVTREYIEIVDHGTGYFIEEVDDDDGDEDEMDQATAEIDKTAAMGVALTTLINSLQGKEKDDLIEVLRSTLESGGDTDT